MKIVRIILPILTLAVLLFYHNSIITLGLNMRLSFTFSKILPYMVEFFAVCLIIYQVYSQYLMNTSLTVRRLVSILVLFGGCGIAFAVNPIYEGDFSHEYKEVSLAGENEDAFKHGLTMVALPGCSFCYNQLERMKRVKEIYPSLPMYVLVMNNDQLALEEYIERSEGKIQVDLFPNSVLLKSLVKGGFPKLIYASNSESVTFILWENNGFGSASWDYILEEEGL